MLQVDPDRMPLPRQRSWPALARWSMLQRDCIDSVAACFSLMLEELINRHAPYWLNPGCSVENEPVVQLSQRRHSTVLDIADEQRDGTSKLPRFRSRRTIRSRAKSPPSCPMSATTDTNFRSYSRDSRNTRSARVPALNLRNTRSSGVIRDRTLIAAAASRHGDAVRMARFVPNMATNILFRRVTSNP